MGPATCGLAASAAQTQLDVRTHGTTISADSNQYVSQSQSLTHRQNNKTLSVSFLTALRSLLMTEMVDCTARPFIVYVEDIRWWHVWHNTMCILCIYHPVLKGLSNCWTGEFDVVFSTVCLCADKHSVCASTVVLQAMPSVYMAVAGAVSQGPVQTLMTTPCSLRLLHQSGCKFELLGIMPVDK